MDGSSMFSWFKSLFGNSQPDQLVERNAPCPCGSGKKFKKCCLEKVAAAERNRRAGAHMTAGNRGGGAGRTGGPGPGVTDRNLYGGQR
jgi:hypothetical protein